MKLKHNKYNVSDPSKRTYKGRTYDSKAEMLYAVRLDLLIKAGEVLDYVDQPKVHISGDLWYRPDFFVVEPEQAYYVDVKGVMTDGFRKIMAAWPARPGFPLRIVKRKGDGFIVTETINSHHHAAGGL